MTDNITEINPQVTTEEVTEVQPVFYEGKELKLKYTLFSLIQLKEVQGVDLNDFKSDEEDETEMDFTTLVKMIWAGMINEYPDLTFTQAAMAFEISDVQGLSAEMNRAMSASTAVGKPALSAGLVSQ